MGLRIPPGSGIVPQSATFDSGTVKFQYYMDGGPWDGGGSPSTFSVPGTAKFYTHFTVTVSGNQIISTTSIKHIGNGFQRPRSSPMDFLLTTAS